MLNRRTKKIYQELTNYGAVNREANKFVETLYSKASENQKEQVKLCFVSGAFFIYDIMCNRITEIDDEEKCVEMVDNIAKELNKWLESKTQKDG